MNTLELTQAERDVVEERRRHVTEEGWTAGHDDDHTDGELAQAAMAFCQSSFEPVDAAYEDYAFWWPFEETMKRKTPREDLVRAGALILAEIERIDRLNAKADGR